MMHRHFSVVICHRRRHTLAQEPDNVLDGRMLSCGYTMYLCTCQMPISLSTYASAQHIFMYLRLRSDPIRGYDNLL